MSTEDTIEETTTEQRIDAAASSVGSAWPLHSFVTANPLSGFEDRPFHEASAEAERLFGSDGYPSVEVFRNAWEADQIDPTILRTELDDHGYHEDAETLLDGMETDAATETDDERGSAPDDQLDHIVTKWLAAFLDQGRTEWPMPNRSQGFYNAFRSVASHDSEIPDSETISELSDDPLETIESILADQPPSQWEAIFETHFAALPGWVGLIKQQADSDDAWQSAYPISLADYLAVRLTVADLLDAPTVPPTAESADNSADDSEITDKRLPLSEIWLTAWERTYREPLVDTVSEASESLADGEDSGRPDAQLVFCIDTRSEIIRRHIESTGEYETHGYAGFFGIPMRYQGYDSDVTVDACPPIVDPAHRISDHPKGGHSHGHDHKKASYDRWADSLRGGKNVLKKLKSNAATAFSFVETAGVGYGAALTAKTLLPSGVSKLFGTIDDRVPSDHEFCEPSVDYNPDAVHELREGLTLGEKIEYAQTAFDLMGIEEFARLVVFTGHASETSNNPFDSSLDCGACAGNPGGPSARVLAAICNDEAVLEQLRADGYDIPEDTLFVAGEHNTTTDEITLYTSDLPASHETDIQDLETDLATAREGAAAERAASMGADGDGVEETKRRAADWAEARPEMGLAGNAGFVIGPSELTSDVDLGGRSFLHSYDWSTDPEGEALEAIMAGPMVVTQWINNQYYFATIDNAVFGSGSKITQNPVGNVGVYQGNGGDLMTGLPLQSVNATDDEPFHQPLRLSTVIHAPVERVTEILSEHEELAQLLDNGWLSLTVVDPTQDHQAFEYEGELSWDGETELLSPKPIQTARIA